MGGRGSGRKPGLHSNTSEDYHAVDIDWIQREGSLAPGYVGHIKWSRGGRQIVWIQYRAEWQGMRLQYKTRSYGGPWQEVDELVPYAETATKFGGYRRWFRCPACHRRCRILYGGDRFRCRCCWRITYKSQYEPAAGRAANRAHKIRDRLGQPSDLDDDILIKPKGMHWKSFRRLAEQYERFRQRFWAGVSEYLDYTDPRNLR